MFIYDQQGAILKAATEAKQEGIEEGSREKAIAFSRQLLAHLDDATISQTTGLSMEEIQNLRSTLSLPQT